MLLISFPHNPTTTCVDLPFLTEIVNLAKSHGTLIVHDFAYADLGFDGYMPPSILEVPGAKDIAVEIFSMSKSYNMAGWRVGFCLGNAKMIAALARIKSYLDYGVFQPIQIASIVALRECDEEIGEDPRGVSRSGGMFWSKGFAARDGRCSRRGDRCSSGLRCRSDIGIWVRSSSQSC